MEQKLPTTPRRLGETPGRHGGDTGTTLPGIDANYSDSFLRCLLNKFNLLTIFLCNTKYYTILLAMQRMGRCCHEQDCQFFIT